MSLDRHASLAWAGLDLQAASAAVPVVEAMLKVQETDALVSYLAEAMADARDRGRGDRAWHARAKDSLDEARRQQDEARRHHMKLLLAWAEQYRPEAKR